MKNKTFKEVVDISLEVIADFKKVEKKPWGAEGALIELSKQVGALSKQVMIAEGYYMAGRDSLPDYQASKDAIGDELSDILLMIIRIADHYRIDLEEVHLDQMEIASNHPLMKIKPDSKE